ncbi:hypothetical protein K440DRAFT_601314 [Wilcoxina mikolae CBS 423.85]|nr:hypothetical protein K440DRAFT_601314 [Wilcoxina mikolae CBS 423.85]
MVPCITTFQHAQNLNHIQEKYRESTLQYISLEFRVIPSKAADKITVHGVLDGECIELGCLETSIATAIAPLLSRRLVRTQAVADLPLKFGHRRGKQSQTITMEIYVNLFGDREHGGLIGHYLSEETVYLQNPRFPDSGYEYNNPQMLSRPTKPVITQTTLTGGINIKSRKVTEKNETPVLTTEAINLFDSIWESAIIDEEDANWRIKTPLMSHQRQGLYFLRRREKGLPAFDAADTTAVNLKTFSGITRGGILADHMGLGKTLTILSLIAGSLDESRDTHNCMALDSGSGRLVSSATLIVAPVSTLDNWEEQISAHTYSGTIKHFMYHGKSRPTDAHSLLQHDIIITSYHVVAQEWKTKNSPLQAINWFRVVLDEAHEIRTEATQRSQAICSLNAERRWCVSGTPLQNGLNDIATLFKFLRYEPLHTKAGFHKYVLSAQTDGKNGMDNLRSALRALCLRRTKDTIKDKLPPREEVIKTLRLSNGEQDLYDEHVQNMCIRGTLNKSNMAETLQCLLKLRLICNHGEDLLSRGFVRNPGLKLNCAVCQVQLVEEDIQVEGRACPHRKLCAGCVELTQCVRGYDSQDPECEACLSQCNTPEPMLSNTLPNYKGPSTKVRALLDSIRADCDATPDPPKHVVFSVWTRMLDLVAHALTKAKISFCRLDGSMSRLRRSETMQQFRQDPSKVVFLISLMAGGVGINLTSASRVHVLEPHWNPMVEQQAVERVHRIGQTRAVKITRYIIQDSFEVDMLKLQRKKLELAKKSLDAGMPYKTRSDKELLAVSCFYDDHFSSCC